MTLFSGIPRSLSACLAACLVAGSVQAQTPVYQQSPPVQHQVYSPESGPGPQESMLPPPVEGEGRIRLGKAPLKRLPADSPQDTQGSQPLILQSNYDPAFGTSVNNQPLGAPMPRSGAFDSGGYLSHYAPNMIGDFLGSGIPKQYQFNQGLGAANVSFMSAYGLFEGLAPGFIPGTTTNLINPETGAMNTPLTGNQMFIVNEAQGALGNTALPVTTLTATTPGHPNPGPLPPPTITTVGQAPVLTDVFQAPTLDPNSLYLQADPNNSSYGSRLINLTTAGAPGLATQINALQSALTAAGVEGTLTQTSAHTAILDSTVATLVQIPDFTDLNGDGAFSPGEEFTDFNANNIPDPGEYNDINMNGMLDSGEQFDHNGNGSIDGEWKYKINPITLFNPGDYTFTQTPLTFALPQSPGALVGREKIGQNGSPRPRQRYFFNYGYFDNTNFGGTNVNRFTLGFEKTFLADQASLEVRIPIAASVNNQITTGAFSNSGSSNMGDVTAFLKFVIYDDSELLLSAGSGVSLPTADDILISDPNGTSLIKVKNQAIHVLPFVGFLSNSQHSNFFYQGFVQGDIDVNGNPVSVTGFETSTIAYQAGTTLQMFQLQRPSGRLEDAGDLNDPTRLMVDLSMGYWINNPMPYVQKIAPMMELHINTDMNVADSITHGNLTCLSSASSLTVINGTVGLTAMINPRLTASAGYSFPLGDEKRSELDGEFRAFFNWYFPNGFRNL